jgi:hypothetical protein
MPADATKEVTDAFERGVRVGFEKATASVNATGETIAMIGLSIAFVGSIYLIYDTIKSDYYRRWCN